MSGGFEAHPGVGAGYDYCLVGEGVCGDGEFGAELGVDECEDGRHVGLW